MYNVKILGKNYKVNKFGFVCTLLFILTVVACSFIGIYRAVYYFDISGWLVFFAILFTVEITINNNRYALIPFKMLHEIYVFAFFYSGLAFFFYSFFI